MSTYFSDASASTPRRHRPLTQPHQSNSWLGGAAVLNKLARWTERSQRRAAFRDLADDPHLLRDIGLTQRQAMEEANKSFWR
jgi:uncharacterized protein YjiS (DUF1127 family)